MFSIMSFKLQLYFKFFSDNMEYFEKIVKPFMAKGQINSSGHQTFRPYITIQWTYIILKLDLDSDTEKMSEKK